MAQLRPLRLRSTSSALSGAFRLPSFNVWMSIARAHPATRMRFQRSASWRKATVSVWAIGVQLVPCWVHLSAECWLVHRRPRIAPLAAVAHPLRSRPDACDGCRNPTEYCSTNQSHGSAQPWMKHGPKCSSTTATTSWMCQEVRSNKTKCPTAAAAARVTWALPGGKVLSGVSCSVSWLRWPLVVISSSCGSS